MAKLLNKKELLQSLNLLNDFLTTNKAINKATMNLSMFQGFLCSLISSPCLIMPNDWMYVLFGGFPEFESIEQQTAVYEAVLSLNAHVKANLATQNRETLMLWDENGIEIEITSATDKMLIDFCTGYIKGYLLDPILKNTFEDLQDFSIAFFLGIIKLANKNNINSGNGKNVDDIMRITLINLIVDNYLNWRQIRGLNLCKTYFNSSFYK